MADPSFDLPPRRETFLARYPRNLKMAPYGGALALVILPPAFIHGQLHKNGVAGGSTGGAEMPQMPALGAKVETDASAPALNDQDDRSIKLIAAPDARVSEDNADGTLPRISEDGLHPWQDLRAPFQRRR